MTERHRNLHNEAVAYFPALTGLPVHGFEVAHSAKTCNFTVKTNCMGIFVYKIEENFLKILNMVPDNGSLTIEMAGFDAFCLSLFDLQLLERKLELFRPLLRI